MCNFPAKELLRMRRQVASQADKSNDPHFVETAGRFLMGIDRLRMDHEELSGCGCWYEAVRNTEQVTT